MTCNVLLGLPVSQGQIKMLQCSDVSCVGPIPKLAWMSDLRLEAGCEWCIQQHTHAF